MQRMFVSVALLSGWGCADTTPLPFADSADASPSDGGQVPPQVIEACRQCMTSNASPCPAAYQECAADPRCLGFMRCVLETGCLAVPELQQRIECADPCFLSSGIQAGTDPALTKGLALNACTLPAGPCGSACVIE
ncbi:MAG TPA: hypothetical protein VK524_18330 [Polyangiaceae bacterium]|nr:hypothetical protein [Polyangiaceae bacterium]